MAIQLPSGLTSLAEVVGHLYGGNTIGRTLHAFRAFGGAKSGQSYTFRIKLDNSGTAGHKNIVARCIPI